MELMHRFMERGDKRNRGESEGVKKRTVGELLQAAEERTEKWRKLAAKKAAAEKVRRAREAEIARTKHLDKISGRSVSKNLILRFFRNLLAPPT